MKRRARERGPTVDTLRKARVLAEATLEGDAVVAKRHGLGDGRTIRRWREELLSDDGGNLSKHYRAHLRSLDSGWKTEASATLAFALRELRRRAALKGDNAMTTRELIEVVRSIGDVRVTADALVPDPDTEDPDDGSPAQNDREGSPAAKDAAGDPDRTSGA